MYSDRILNLKNNWIPDTTKNTNSKKTSKHKNVNRRENTNLKKNSNKWKLENSQRCEHVVNLKKTTRKTQKKLKNDV